MSARPLPIAVAGLVPHTGTMCLLDAVVEFDAQRIVCRATSHRLSANPLRHAGRLAASAAIEYAAQAMAAHGALAGASSGEAPRPRAGMLVATRGVILARETLHDVAGDLRVEARAVTRDDRGLVYDFEVSSEAEPVASGRLTVALLAADMQ